MRKVIYILLLLCVTTTMHAQRITHEYHNVSLSDALRQLNDESKDYEINFLYNELEDFRITTFVHRKTVPDAIRQMIGFYPIRMVVDGNEIIVECVQKTDTRYKGNVIDEAGHPMAYANITLLSPQDSTLLAGGVSNESGLFVIPCDRKPVIARITFVGYKTIYKQSKTTEIGTIRMQPETYTIKGVVVSGERPKVQLKGNSLVMNVEGTVMERLGSAEDVLSRVPMISKRGESFEILGKGVPLIYLNNRKLTDLQELKNIQSDHIKNVEVIQNPGARYDATVNAVIIIHTKRAAGEGLGVELTSWNRKGHGYVNNERINLTYRKKGLELFANLFGAYNKKWMHGEFQQTVYADTLWNITDRQKHNIYNPYFEGRIGFNYQLDDQNSFGGFYQSTYDYVKTLSDNTDELLANGELYDHLHNNSLSRDEGNPRHQVNLYYTGKIGQLSIDFNADYTFRKQTNRTIHEELSDEYEDRNVNTYALTHSRLFAEKLFVTHPLWKGQIEVGEEYTNTRWNSSFENAEGYIGNTDNEQHEQAIAPFMELRQQLGHFQLQAGLRYEHVESDYFVGGQRRNEQCRTYNNLFPSIAVSTGIKKVQLSASYSKRSVRPAYWQLSSDVEYENRLNWQTGNPYLKPIKYHNFNLMAMWKWLFLTTNFSHCVDPIINSAEILEQDTKVNFVTLKNYNHADWLTVTLGAQKNIKLAEGVIWTPQYNISLMPTWFKTDFLGKQKSFNHTMLSLQLGNLVALPHDWLFQADFMMHTHGYQQNVWIDCTNAMLSLSVSKDFFRHHLNVKLSGNDLFNGGINHITLYSNRMMFRKMEDHDSRCVQLSLRYRFNVTPSKYKGTGAGNAEKNRL